MAFVPWIKIEQTLPDKPEIIRMASALRIDQDAVTGKLLRVWIWVDANIVSGEKLPITAAFIDRLTNCRKFSEAMRSVGWLTGEDGALVIPGFERHNGETAKDRAKIARRVDKFRRRDDLAVMTGAKVTVTPSVTDTVTPSVTDTVTPSGDFPLHPPLPRRRAREEDTPQPPFGGASGSASGGFAADTPAAPPAPAVATPGGQTAPPPTAPRPPAMPYVAPSVADDRFLIAHIKSLRRRWQASPLLSAREARIFRKNRAIVTLFTPDDWHTLAEFMTTRLPEGSGWFQPEMLEKFLDNPGAILGHARDWKTKQRSRSPTPHHPPPLKPDGPPATAEERRQILGMRF